MWYKQRERTFNRESRKMATTQHDTKHHKRPGHRRYSTLPHSYIARPLLFNTHHLHSVYYSCCSATAVRPQTAWVGVAPPALRAPIDLKDMNAETTWSAPAMTPRPTDGKMRMAVRPTETETHSSTEFCESQPHEAVHDSTAAARMPRKIRRPRTAPPISQIAPRM